MTRSRSLVYSVQDWLFSLSGVCGLWIYCSGVYYVVFHGLFIGWFFLFLSLLPVPLALLAYRFPRVRDWWFF